MCIYSDFWIRWEKKNLAPYATRSDHVWYSRRGDNQKDQPLDPFGTRSRYRTAFELDKDRITNSQAFRRLEYKTQVFVTHEGDNYRTRLTHSLEVAEIARHIARALRLNEHLTEAIALGHDLGHAPYGHVAEETINNWIKEKAGENISSEYYFCHNRQSVEIVDHLEPGYDWDTRKREEGFGCGLNLTNAVREGILVHTGRGYRGPAHKHADFEHGLEPAVRALSDANREKRMFFPGTLEAQVVRISDDIAQRIHDLEDGLRSGLLHKSDIVRVIKGFFDEMRKDKNLDPMKHEPRPPVKFLQDILDMAPGADAAPLTESENSDVTRLSRVAHVAYLLYMWRNPQYLKDLGPKESEAAKKRILKYYHLLTEILDKRDYEKPAYNLIAFLRGIMLANVIEHSFWQIHTLLDPEFRESHTDQSHGNDMDNTNTEDDNEDMDKSWYVIFTIVDGLVKENQQNVEFTEFNGEQRLFCFKFKTSDTMDTFMGANFRKILNTNGACLTSLQEHPSFQKISKVNWINKSEDPEETEFVTIHARKNDKGRLVPLEQVQIYFTGYKDLCPGSEQCARATDSNVCTATCSFYCPDVKYPDIRRIVQFQQCVDQLDSHLAHLISERVHHRSRIARMNYMGNKIICGLLEAYLECPRMMHDRVWHNLRVFPGRDLVAKKVADWCNQTMADKDRNMFPHDVLELLLDHGNVHYQHHRYTLVRRIIDHVTGMTDRYISDEYNRLQQSGREVEVQDETYFFS